MENSSQILDFMFLGSEWNAANRSELIQNGITHILNITKEIDNFYPGMIFIAKSWFQTSFQKKMPKNIFIQSKVGRMIAVFTLPHAEFGSNGHFFICFSSWHFDWFSGPRWTEKAICRVVFDLLLILPEFQMELPMSRASVWNSAKGSNMSKPTRKIVFSIGFSPEDLRL